MNWSMGQTPAVLFAAILCGYKLQFHSHKNRFFKIAKSNTHKKAPLPQGFGIQVERLP